MGISGIPYVFPEPLYGLTARQRYDLNNCETFLITNLRRSMSFFGENSVSDGGVRNNVSNNAQRMPVMLLGGNNGGFGGGGRRVRKFRNNNNQYTPWGNGGDGIENGIVRSVEHNQTMHANGAIMWDFTETSLDSGSNHGCGDRWGIVRGREEEKGVESQMARRILARLDAAEGVAPTQAQQGVLPTVSSARKQFRGPTTATPTGTRGSTKHS